MIDIRAFAGTRPRIAPDLLQDDEATIASGVVLGSGALDPEVLAVHVSTVTKAGSVKSIHWLPAAGVWLHWTTDVDVVPDPRADNTNGRVIYTGDGKPKFTDNTLAVTGVGTDYPLSSYKLGIDKPATAASLTVGGGSGQQETRAYVYTFVDAYGSEGPPSDPLSQTGFINGTWNFDGMAAAAPAETNVTLKRIYRTVTASDGEAVYLFVAEIAIGTANYADVIAATALGEELPSADWVEPPSDMTAICALPGGILAGISGNEICFCEPYQPHAWPEAYRIPLDYTPVGLGSFNSNLVAPTNGTPYLITGSHPEEMSPTQIDATEPCVAKRTIVSFGFGVAYISQNGVVMVTTAGTQVVTRDLFSADQWKSLIGYSDPLVSVAGALAASRYRDKYIFFATGGALVNTVGIIDRSNDRPCFYHGTLLELGTVDPAAFFVNKTQEDQLYILGNNKKVYAYGWSTGQLGEDLQPYAPDRAYHEATWISKRFRLPRPVSMAWLRVDCDLTNAHPAYLEHPTALTLSITSAASIMGKAVMGGEIMGGGSLLYYPGSSTAGYDQGYCLIRVYAGNHQGRSAGDRMGSLTLIDTQYVRGAYPFLIANNGKYDTWQIEVVSACRVRRVQLAASIDQLRGS